ncbi:hypothetical protein BS17DRAFT_314804 [Gyrodon lividus]|nr:hypothetical protein BS17DRAFT_314804 [Gyrodon lividus]
MSGPVPKLRQVNKPMRNSIRGLPAIPSTQGTNHSNRSMDFWIPKVTEDGQVMCLVGPKQRPSMTNHYGQIYYANTLTGKLSRDLPKDTEDDVSNGDLAGLTGSQSSSRAGTGAGLGFVLPINGPLDANVTPHPQTEVHAPVQAPEPPSSSLAFQEHRQNISISPAPPTNPPSNHHANHAPGVLLDSLAAQSRQGSHSTLDGPQPSLPHQRSMSLERNHCG